jgi:FAD/FMN-containing dehydrogenase
MTRLPRFRPAAATALLSLAAAALAGCEPPRPEPAGFVVNDVHSRLNETRVRSIVQPGSTAEVQAVVRRAREEGLAISIAGGRHAMGGQQFGEGTVLLDMSGMNRIVSFDRERGRIVAEAGAQWPALIDYLLANQAGAAAPWGIVQKQTGADRLSLGGALSANIHGRGLALRPIVQDVESFLLVDADGEARRCSREENAERFRLAIGGYGLFGVITEVELRLAPRRRLERVVEVIDVEALMPSFAGRIAAGFLYGDFQYAIDPASDDFLHKGVFSCYRPVPDGAPEPPEHREMPADDWGELYYLAHADKTEAFRRYAAYYLSTGGQVYWSDTHQLSVYLDDYHRALDARLGSPHPGSEMITEIYVPREALAGFLADVRDDFRRHEVDLIYGTIRLIERDGETFLAWARESWACVIFNLHVEHTDRGIERAAADFRRLIDRAIERGGSFFLTYHRWATRQQMDRCYPQFAEFLRAKLRLDPDERFQSEWYRHFRAMYADSLGAG